MNAWFLSTLLASRDAAILALAIGGLRALVGRRMPAVWRHRLWLLVALRLLLPVIPASPVSWQRVIPVVEQSMRPAMPSQVPDAPERPLPVFESPPDEPEATLALPPPPRQTAVRWVDLLAAIWLGGVGTFAAFALFTSLRFRRRMRRLTVMGHPLAERLRAMIEETGWSRMPRLRLTDAVSSPALTGLFRPEILMPPSVVDRLSDAELRLVILHELGHWRRRDLWVHLGLVLLQAIHWFNPLIWWAFHRTRIEGERATDAWVLRRAGDDQAATYGEMLLRLLESGARHRPAFSGIVSVVEGPADLRQRIVAIARFRGRRNRWTAILSGALLAGLAAVGLTQAPQVEDGGDRTRVTVTDEFGKPLAGAQVWLLEAQSGPLDTAPPEIGRTDGKGILEFPISPDWKAMKELYVRKKDGVAATAKLIPFPAAAVSVEFQAGKSLRFRVLDPAGNPVPGMRVRVANAMIPDEPELESEELPDFWAAIPEQLVGFWDAVTDRDGRCEIGPLPSGRYYVDHADSRFAQVPGGHNLQRQYNPEIDRDEIEIRLVAAATITGFVRFPNGRPVPGALVKCLEHYDYRQGGSSAECWTDAEGYFQLKRLLPSHYSVRVDLPNHLETDWTIDINNLPIRTGEERSWLVLELTKGCLITGKVTLADTGAPVPNLTIGGTSIDSISPLYQWWARTDGFGFYRMRIPAGGRKVYLGGGSPPSGYGCETADGQQLSVIRNAIEGETVQVDFALPRNTSIQGRVVDPTGKPVVGATVRCSSPSSYGEDRRTQTGPDGRFSIELPGGAEEVLLMAEHEEMLSGKIWYPVNEEAELRLVEQGFASASGSVVDPEGKPIAGARVVWTGESVSGLPMETTTDHEGRYRVAKLVPGTHIGFWASQPGYGKTLRQADLEAGKTAEVAPIVLPLATGVAGGTVVDPAGAPASGVLVRGDGYLQPDGVETHTDAAGRFELKGLVAGWFDLLVGEDTKVRTRTGTKDIVAKLDGGEPKTRPQELIDLTGKPAPPLRAEVWIHSDPLPEHRPGKVRLLVFVGLDRALIFFDSTLAAVQKLRSRHPVEAVEIILVHGHWPKEEVSEILARDHPDFTIPVAIEPQEGALSEALGAQTWLNVVIDPQGKIVCQGPGNLKKAEETIVELLGGKKTESSVGSNHP